MKKRFKILLVVIIAVCLCLIACGKKKEHEKDPESKKVRIYDVEPQDRPDALMNVQHYVRLGVVKHVGYGRWEIGYNTGETQMPFANQLERIEEASGAEIEYIVVDNWEELRKIQEEFDDAAVTEMILFNNSYDESLIKEASSGNYADMSRALEKLGFYNEENYEQIVLQAGVTEKGQTLVPLLYNVSGMIQGEKERTSIEEWREQSAEHRETANISYEEMIQMLEEALHFSIVEAMELPYMSAGFLEDKVDLYLTAAGIEWDSYGDQEELFKLLYQYLTLYQETQIDVKEDLVSNQKLYGKWLHDHDETSYMDGDPQSEEEIQREMRELSVKEVDQLQLWNYQTESMPTEDPQKTGISIGAVFDAVLNRTQYFVESSEAEEVAFHSVFGLLHYQKYYVERNSSYDFLNVNSFGGTMDYYPIGILDSNEKYAAQPICYAAVVDGGNTELAASVIQAMLQQEIDSIYGISINNTIKDWQLEDWVMGQNKVGSVRYRGYSRENATHSESVDDAYWHRNFLGVGVPTTEHKEVYASQVAEQLDNITVAQIPDREILSIWQDTLTESVESGLSAQEGFELLCERMDAWYKD